MNTVTEEVKRLNKKFSFRMDVEEAEFYKVQYLNILDEGVEGAEWKAIEDGHCVDFDVNYYRLVEKKPKKMEICLTSKGKEVLDITSSYIYTLGNVVLLRGNVRLVHEDFVVEYIESRDQTEVTILDNELTFLTSINVSHGLITVTPNRIPKPRRADRNKFSHL